MRGMCMHEGVAIGHSLVHLHVTSGSYCPALSMSIGLSDTLVAFWALQSSRVSFVVSMSIFATLSSAVLHIVDSILEVPVVLAPQWPSKQAVLFCKLSKHESVQLALQH